MTLLRTNIDFFLVTSLFIFSKVHGQNSVTQDGFVGASDIFNGASVLDTAMLDQSSASGEFKSGFLGPQDGHGDIAQSRSNSVHSEHPPIFFHGNNVHHTSGSPSQLSPFVDLTGGVQLGPGNTVAVKEVENQMPAVSQAPTDGFSNSGAFDGFIQDGSSGLPWEQPSQPAENKLPPGVTFMGGRSDTQVGQTLRGTRTGNRRRPSFVETEIPVAGKPQFTAGASNLGNVINQGTFPSSEVHVDMPGQHGNTGGTAVVHREGLNTGAVLNPTFGSNSVNVHVDMQAQHEHTTIPSSIHHNNGQPNSVGGVHIDMPGEHGNTGPHPVVHRQPFNPTDILNKGPSLPGMNVHIDQPGEHGNTANIALVHREHLNPGAVLNPGAPSQGVIGSVHVDLPGEHGNTGNVPLIHRETGSPHVPGTQQIGSVHGGSGGLPGVGQLMGGVHVDMPGQHGNPGNLPVVHREWTGTFGTNGFQHEVQLDGSGFPLSNVHVDMPGEHGNQGNAAVIHREGVHSPGPFGTSGVGFPPTGQLGSPGVSHGNAHVDMPSEQGNQGHAAVVHREGSLLPGPFGAPGLGFQPRPQFGVSSFPLGNVRVDMPREHGNQGHIAGVRREGSAPVATLPGTQGFGISPLVPLQVPGFHSSGPFSGGREIPRDRRPVDLRADHSEAHVDIPGKHGNPLNRQPSRVQPFGGHRISIGPVVATGVIPGTPNVPIPPRRPFRGRGLDRRVHLQHDVPGNVGRDRVDYPAERGGRRGTPEREPTAHAPSNTGSGITVVHVRRQNPLGALGNAMRSAFRIGSGNPIGLLGSLPNSPANVPPMQRFLPPLGRMQMVPVRRTQTPPNNPINGLLQSILGSLFGG
ncbi:hypothetical protein DPMN_103927 [Dreissena polymorpha]|uniref:Uncharacterized protein n=1 Tax=Dreissena polymorpha TaxID=45954 RepID=A0A9D4HC14_DREPO|nr:hypothetical protein DPMN_103927 [Dreissena polymorpha]